MCYEIGMLNDEFNMVYFSCGVLIICLKCLYSDGNIAYPCFVVMLQNSKYTDR